MECNNCGNIIPDDSAICQYCNIYINQYISRNGHSKALLILEDGTKFNLAQSDKIRVGRKDVTHNPDIDLGPYDNKLTLSRLHGIFLWENDVLYYIDKSTNGTVINRKKILKNKKVKINDNDIIYFSHIKAEIFLN